MGIAFVVSCFLVFARFLMTAMSPPVVACLNRKLEVKRGERGMYVPDLTQVPVETHAEVGSRSVVARHCGAVPLG